MAKRKKATKKGKTDWHEVAYVALIVVAGLVLGVAGILLARY